MRKALLATLTLLALFSLASAQEGALSIAFVRSGAVLAAHPAGQEAAQLTEQARTELQQIATGLQPLQARANAGEELSAEEHHHAKRDPHIGQVEHEGVPAPDV